MRVLPSQSAGSLEACRGQIRYEKFKKRSAFSILIIFTNSCPIMNIMIPKPSLRPTPQTNQKSVEGDQPFGQTSEIMDYANSRRYDETYILPFFSRE